MDSNSPFAFTPAQADELNKVFVIRCFEIQLGRMVPGLAEQQRKDIAAVAEQAMTESPDIKIHPGLKAIVSSVCPDEQSVPIIIDTLALFSSNIVGAMIHKGPEILEGTFTAETFFEMFGR